MPELVVISGKGGTGKTSIVATLAALAGDAVLVDCDVQAPDWHLLLDPQPRQTEEFMGGEVAHLNWAECLGCGRCAQLCRWRAIVPLGMPNRFSNQTYAVNAWACEGCRLCAEICPNQAVTMVPAVAGEWYLSDTRHGPLVHARLRPGHGNSGKLVSLLRAQARDVARTTGRGLMLADGVPGVGCPVIASVGGADLALAVTEPSVAALHDLERVLALTRHFAVPAVLCINRYDLAPDVTARIEAHAAEVGVEIIGRVPCDERIVAAQMAGRSVVEDGVGPAQAAIKDMWTRLRARLACCPAQTEAKTQA